MMTREHLSHSSWPTMQVQICSFSAKKQGTQPQVQHHNISRSTRKYKILNSSITKPVSSHPFLSLVGKLADTETLCQSIYLKLSNKSQQIKYITASSQQFMRTESWITKLNGIIAQKKVQYACWTKVTIGMSGYVSASEYTQYFRLDVQVNNLPASVKLLSLYDLPPGMSTSNLQKQGKVLFKLSN